MRLTFNLKFDYLAHENPKPSALTYENTTIMTTTQHHLNDLVFGTHTVLDVYIGPELHKHTHTVHFTKLSGTHQRSTSELQIYRYINLEHRRSTSRMQLQQHSDYSIRHTICISKKIIQRCILCGHETRVRTATRSNATINTSDVIPWH
jgi:hypothetical protein